MDYADYYGGAVGSKPRKLSAWNLFVKEHAPEYKGKNMPAGAMLKELAKRARAQGGIIRVGASSKRSECAKDPYYDRKGVCLTNMACAWRTSPKLTKKGKPRKAFCTKGIRKVAL